MGIEVSKDLVKLAGVAAIVVALHATGASWLLLGGLVLVSGLVSFKK
jgi:hypothetical protein